MSVATSGGAPRRLASVEAARNANACNRYRLGVPDDQAAPRQGQRAGVHGASGGALVYRTELGNLHRLCDRIGIPRYAFHQIRHWAGMVATSMGKSKKAVAQFLGQTDTGATERYMHVVELELWAVAQRPEAELSAIPAEAAVAQIGGVKSGMSGVKNGVKMDAVGCSQVSPDVGKSSDFRLGEVAEWSKAHAC